nr:N-acetylmuramoyl-L-alanine amidase [Alkalibacillus aidingensis]
MGGDRKRSEIHHIARHHSASNGGDVWTFEEYWREQRGWETGGYHEIILRDGTVQLCYDHDVITNGVANHNSTTYHICVVGNGDFTEEQEHVFDERAEYNLDRFGLSTSDLLGHNEFSGTSTGCPGTDMDQVRSRLDGESEESDSEGSSDSDESGSSDDSGDDLLRRGDSGPEVEELQNDLMEVGESLPSYGADGIFGQETEEAVRNFQNRADIQVDGIVGPETRAALEEEMSGQSGLPRGTYRQGSRGEAVRKIQQALEDVNFSPGPIDGIYGPQTEDAVRRFQEVHVPHEVDGIYGPNTRAALEDELS